MMFALVLLAIGIRFRYFDLRLQAFLLGRARLLPQH